MEELPAYKLEFLEQLEQQKLQQQQNEQGQNSLSQTQQDLKSSELPFKVTNTNDIWNSTKYQQNYWRKNLYTSYYNNEHGQKQFDVNTLLNPEVVTKERNMRVTQISEYSNAKHNNTVRLNIVFNNPKFSSC